MKYHITVTQETTNLLLGALERKLEKITLENSDIVTELKKAKDKIIANEKLLENNFGVNRDLIGLNDKLEKEVSELKEQLENSDFEAEKTKNKILEGKLETLRENRDKERELYKEFILGILNTFGIAVSEEIATLIDARDYFKAASKINAEIKKEVRKATGAEEPDRQG